MRIQVSKNELGTALEKAAVGQGFDQGTGQWLSGVVIQAVQNDYPGVTWALQSLEGKPARPEVEHRQDGWVCLNKAVLVAGPVLTDFLMAGQPLQEQGFISLDTPDLWTHLMKGGFGTKQGPISIDFDDWKALQKLAAKTYVPASELSRQVAGANSPDTD